MYSWTQALFDYGRGPTDRLAALVYCRDDLPRRLQRRERLRNASGILPKLTLNMCQPLEKTLADLRRYRPDFLGGYPGVLLRLAQMADRRHRRAIRPRVIWVGGEVLTDQMRRGISDVFGGRVYNCYASEEFKLVGWECTETGELHVLDDNVIVEVLRDGRPCAPGERGEIVVTGLRSYAMPFIRYRLGDVVTMGSPACACGRPYSTIREIQGRTLDYFTMPDGRLLHPYDIIRPIHSTSDWIWRHQLVQERRDRIVLQAVPRGRPRQDAVQRIEQSVKAVLGPDVEFTVTLVNRLDPDAGGKLRYARSLVGPR
jgi:phenylacetate-CoA ligase